MRLDRCRHPVVSRRIGRGSCGACRQRLPLSLSARVDHSAGVLQVPRAALGSTRPLRPQVPRPSRSRPAGADPARSVNPMPSPPTSTRGRSADCTRRQATVASASSEPCVRLDIRVSPFTRMTYLSSRTVKRMSLPSGVSVCPSSSHALRRCDLTNTLRSSRSRQLRGSRVGRSVRGHPHRQLLEPAEGGRAQSKSVIQ